ncbi:PilW family protein [Chloroflexota bacterium]
MFRKLVNISKNQKGFTILEMLIAVAITGLIVGGIALTIIQLFEGHAQSSGEMTALRQVQNTGYHISRDAKMAEIIDTSDDSETPDVTEVLTIMWTEIVHWKNEPLGEVDYMISTIIRHKIVYTWDDGIIDRSEYNTGEIREDEETYTYTLNTGTRVAEYIWKDENKVEDGFEFNPSTNELTVTATTGGFGSQTETRTYKIEPRPDTMYWQ